ncbi:LysM peptidoglycan-binding domain-containing protein [Psychrobacter sp. I-STPA10]|uniref:LysM peptidoglycan-binding domain-containing protein n=1 Tax=Psychrobacter sp. I-STPA10 TaxID=2585769 RepID=UPI001E2DFE49|nr:LysM peptidoglycan-binding domain-containing protein [Psychrobacter sp. I-STPA10]
MKSKQTILKRLITTSVAGLMLLAGSSVYANNPPPTIKVDAPNRYIVKKGDTLWAISGRYLDSPWRWKEIWAANRQIKNPNLIYPGDVLILCVIKGQTLVGIDTGKGCAGVEEAITKNTHANVTTTQSITITPLDNSIPPIPLSAIQYWLDRAAIVNPEDLETTPYVFASKNSNLLTSTGDTIYARGVALIIGQKYGIYRIGEPYVDNKTQKVVGVEVKEVASGIVTAVAANGVSSIKLLKAYEEEVREGDRVFVGLGNYLPPVFYPTPAEVNRGGLIVRVMNSISQAAKGSVVVVNLGTKNGAKAGDVLSVFHKGALVRDIRDNDTPVRLPSEVAGHVMIFKTFDNLSYAYVLDAQLPLGVGDQLLTPIDF